MHPALLLLLGLLPSSSAPSILSTVPEGAFALSYCDDVAAFRDRVERNDWVRLLGSETGEPLFLDAESTLRNELGVELRGFVDLGLELRGESVIFATGDSMGFMTVPSGEREALARAMRAMLPAADGAVVRRDLELVGGRVDLAVFPADEIVAEGESVGEGRVHAFVDHPKALGLFAADHEAALVAVVRDAVLNIGSDRRAPVVVAFESARRGVGPTGGVEVFVDFSPFVERANEALATAATELLVDPSALLGLERNTTLYATLDLHPGNRVDCRARLAIPEGSTMAKLADTLRPLPADLPGKIPAGVWAVHALEWDVVGVYDLARAAMEEQQGIALLDQGLDAAEGTTGVDVEALFRQLAGTFALYFVEPAGDGELEEIRSLGLRFALHDGDAFLDAVETLMTTAVFNDALELVEVEGFDAFLVREPADGLDGGAAFLPDALVAAPDRGLLARSLRAHSGEEGASLLDGSPFHAAFDENQGACYLTYVDLDALQRIALPQLGDDPSLPALSGDGEATNPFRAQLVAVARRTTKGVDFRVYTR